MHERPDMHASLIVLTPTGWEAGGRRACSLLDCMRQQAAWRTKARVKIDLSKLPGDDTAATWEELIGLIDAEACRELVIRTKMASLPERRACVCGHGMAMGAWGWMGAGMRGWCEGGEGA